MNQDHPDAPIGDRASHAPATVSDPVVALLRCMARQGAVLLHDPAKSTPPLVVVTRNGAMAKRDVVALAPVQAAVARGLIIREADGRWRLGRRGLVRLRAARAISDGPASTGVGTVTASAPSASGRVAAARPRQAKPIEGSLDWLHQRKDAGGRPMISTQEYEAGQRLAADFERGQMRGRVTTRWDGMIDGGARSGAPGGGAIISDAAADARARFNAALDAVGPDFAGLLVDVCCFGASLGGIERAGNLPQRSAKVVVQFALRALARHYGLLGRCDGSANRPPRLQHWGADGYRPTAARWD